MILDRLVSLADPGARPIRKGKPQRPTGFGYTVLVGECERGFVAACHTHEGNPGDAAQLVPAVTEVIALTGRPPPDRRRRSRVRHRLGGGLMDADLDTLARVPQLVVRRVPGSRVELGDAACRI